MSLHAQIEDLFFREWEPDTDCDLRFVRLMPRVKWNYFIQRLRPLADGCAAGVWDALFSGVVRPFHYQLAQGWMRKVFRKVREAPDWCDQGLTAEEALNAVFVPLGTEAVFAVYGPAKAVYAAEWPVMLDCLKRGWLDAVDTFVLCAEGTRRVALYWEGTGPYFGNREERSLTTLCTEQREDR